MKSTQKPDDIMESAKQKAATNPDTDIVIDLNEREIFKVRYDAKKDQFECSRMVKEIKAPRGACSNSDARGGKSE